jgi:hypothetical protein
MKMKWEAFTAGIAVAIMTFIFAPYMNTGLAFLAGGVFSICMFGSFEKK